MFMPGAVLLDRYEVVGVLGLGGYGIVLRARDAIAGHEVAIKILRADLELDHENTARFLREAHAIEQLRTEHVVRIHDVGTLEEGAPYMVMEVLHGQDLGKLLATRGPLAVPHAVELVLQACDALAEAHGLGIVHRDIKPTNLFVARRPDGTDLVKVLDFGISKGPVLHGELTLTQTQAVLGTPVYMSPEQMRSARDVDARTDVWALGAVLYELVEGRLPFDAENFAELVLMVASSPPPDMVLAPQLARVVARCLAKHPDDRYADVGELAADLERFVATSASARVARIRRVLGSTLSANRRRSVRRRRWIAVAGAAIALAGATVAITAVATTRVLSRESDAGAPAVEIAPAPPQQPPPKPQPEPEPEPAPAAVAVPAPEPPPTLPSKQPPAPPVRAKKPPALKRPEPAAQQGSAVDRKCDPYSTKSGSCT